MNLKPNGRCPLCYASVNANTKVVYEFDVPLGENDQIVQCNVCTHVFVPAPKMESYNNKPLRDYPYDKPNVPGLQFMIGRMRELGAAKEGELLDVGCAAGHFMEAARDLGYAVAGIEPWQACRKYCREERELIVWPSLEEAGKPWARSFKVVSCVEVIEHVADPVGFIKTMAEFLEPGGRIFFTTPNWMSKTRIKLGKDWTDVIIPYGHIHYFDQRSLGDACTRAGLTDFRSEAVGGETLDVQILATARKPGGDKSEEVNSDRCF